MTNGGGKMINLKTKITPRGTAYILTGKDRTNEIAGFKSFKQAALVCRFLNGGNMRDEDFVEAFAAIDEYEAFVAAGKIHYEAGVENGV